RGCTPTSGTTSWAVTAHSSCCSTSRRCTACRRIRWCRRVMPARCGGSRGGRRRRSSVSRCRRSWDAGDDARSAGGAAGGVPVVLRPAGAQVAGVELDDRGVPVLGRSFGRIGDAGGGGGAGQTPPGGGGGAGGGGGVGHGR